MPSVVVAIRQVAQPMRRAHGHETANGLPDSRNPTVIGNVGHGEPRRYAAAGVGNDHDRPASAELVRAGDRAARAAQDHAEAKEAG